MYGEVNVIDLNSSFTWIALSTPVDFLVQTKSIINKLINQVQSLYFSLSYPDFFSDGLHKDICNHCLPAASEKEKYAYH